MKPPHRSPPQSEAWIEAFASQCTEALWEAARKYAAQRAVAVRRVNGAADDYYERELVQDAFADTRLGRVQWDPAVRSLKEHIFAVIRTRTSHDYERALRLRRESFDAGDDDHLELVAEVERALRDRQPNADPAFAIRAAERVAEVRELAASDHGVLAMLAALEDSDVYDKADVMRHLQISDTTYHAAKIRLTRIVKRISAGTPSSRNRRKKGT